MMKLVSLTPEELLDEVVQIAEENGIQNQEEWDSLVDEVVDGHLALGELDKDDDLEETKEVLSARWVEYKNGTMR